MAGVLGAVISAIVYTIAINNIFALGINYLLVAIITIILSLIGQIGDLAASSVKRYCEVKDFGELIPGHGGMLDRIDSVIFILPFAYILLGLLLCCSLVNGMQMVNPIHYGLRTAKNGEDIKPAILPITPQ